MIQLTPNAAKHIQKLLKDDKKSIGVRLGVRASGCIGFVYDFKFVENINENNDMVFESHYVTIVVSKSDMPFLKGTTIDFITEGLNKTFQYINPNEKNTCGCGISFNVE